MAEEKKRKGSVSFHNPNQVDEEVQQKPKKIRKYRNRSKNSFNFRGLITAIIILALLGGGIYLFLHQEVIDDAKNGELITETSECTVTNINPSYQFDTDCGVFQWDEMNLTGTPAGSLVVGQKYSFHAKGLRFPAFGWYPVLIDPPVAV